MSKPIDEAVIRAQLDRTLDSTNLPELGEKYEGKVRDSYVRDGRRTLIATDRISAFDVVLGTIPFKGQVLNEIAAHWFDLSRSLVPNHVLSVPDPNVMVGIECELLQFEFVMRAYLTGSTKTSIWVAYEGGAREFCGHKLPEGMRRHQVLEKPILTPSTKAEKGDHDESVSREELIRRGAIGQEETVVFVHSGGLPIVFAYAEEVLERLP